MAEYNIDASVVIHETGETTECTFDNAVDMMECVMSNIEMAQMVFGRRLDSQEPDINGDDLKWDILYADTREPYMTLTARRHLIQ